MFFKLPFCTNRLSEQPEGSLQPRSHSCIDQKEPLHLICAWPYPRRSRYQKWFLWVWHSMVKAVCSLLLYFYFLFFLNLICLSSFYLCMIVCIWIFGLSAVPNVLYLFTDLNQMDWACQNLLAVALYNNVYLWNANQGDITLLATMEREEDYICSVSWIKEGNFLALGTSDNNVQVIMPLSLKLLYCDGKWYTDSTPHDGIGMSGNSGLSCTFKVLFWAGWWDLNVTLTIYITMYAFLLILTRFLDFVQA